MPNFYQIARQFMQEWDVDICPTLEQYARRYPEHIEELVDFILDYHRLQNIARRAGVILVTQPLPMEKTMHYKNGREAKNGDKVVLMPSYPKDENGKSLATPVIGILYDATAGNDYCNGRIAPMSPSDPCPNLKECLHFDDVKEAIVGAFDEKAAT